MIGLQHDDLTGDLVLPSGGSFRELSGDEGLRQAIENRVCSTRDDWFVDTRAGIPWLAWLGRKDTSLRTIENEVRRAIETLPFVASVKVSASFAENRSVLISLEATLKSGHVVASKDFKPWLR